MIDNAKTPHMTENLEGIYKISRQNKYLKLSGYVLFMLPWLFMFVCTVYILFLDEHLVLKIISSVYGSFAAVIVICCRNEFCREFVKFEFSDTGLVVKFPFQKKQIIGWNEFQEVCICYLLAKIGGNCYGHTQICFVKKGEKKNSFYRWKSSNPFRYKSVITIHYSDEIYELLKIKCPHEVVDLRKNTPYILIKDRYRK